MQYSGEAIIFSGPSGVGKTTIAKLLMDECQAQLERIITTTTRSPRSGEVPGQDYYFRTLADFEEGIIRGDFLEYALVHGNYYGSTFSELDRIFDAGKKALYIVDPQGAKYLKGHLPKTVQVATVFILPPSLEVLRHRLGQRNTESETDFEIRLRDSVDQIREKEHYDIHIVNDDLHVTVEELRQKLF